MRETDDPTGDLNLNYLLKGIREADLVVCAWGVHGAFRNQGSFIRTLISNPQHDLHVLGLTKEGHPKHPLYLRKDLRPQLWTM